MSRGRLYTIHTPRCSTVGQTGPSATVVCTLLSYAKPYWAMYDTPCCAICCILLSYVAPFWAIVHNAPLRKTSKPFQNTYIIYIWTISFFYTWCSCVQTYRNNRDYELNVAGNEKQRRLKTSSLLWCLFPFLIFHKQLIFLSKQTMFYAVIWHLSYSPDPLPRP